MGDAPAGNRGAMTEWIRRWTVPSESDPTKTYVIAQASDGRMGCSCWAWRRNQDKDCKHLRQFKAQYPDGKYPSEGVPSTGPKAVPVAVPGVTSLRGQHSAHHEAQPQLVAGIRGARPQGL